MHLRVFVFIGKSNVTQTRNTLGSIYKQLITSNHEEIYVLVTLIVRLDLYMLMNRYGSEEILRTFQL